MMTNQFGAPSSVCRSAGIEAEIFPDGEAFLGTLSSAASCRPACVIVDFQMPGIDGLELQRRLAPTGVPIIFLTANVRSGRSQEGSRAGCRRLPDKTIKRRCIH
jgi:FixJ family two-component response regulator